MGLVDLKESSYMAAPDRIQSRTTSVTSVRGRKTSHMIKLSGYTTGQIQIHSTPIKARQQEHAVVVALLDKKQTATPNRPTLNRWILGALSTACVASAGFLVVSVFSFLLELSSGSVRLVLPSFSAVVVFAVLTLSTLRLNSSVKEATSGILK